MSQRRLASKRARADLAATSATYDGKTIAMGSLPSTAGALQPRVCAKNLMAGVEIHATGMEGKDGADEEVQLQTDVQLSECTQLSSLECRDPCGLRLCQTAQILRQMPHTLCQRLSTT